MTVRLKAPWAGLAIGQLYTGPDEDYLLGVSKADGELGRGAMIITPQMSHTLTKSDGLRERQFTSDSPVTVRIANTVADMALGVVGVFRQSGVGPISFVADQGVTLTSPTKSFTSNGVGSVVRLVKIDASTVSLVGDISGKSPLARVQDQAKISPSRTLPSTYAVTPTITHSASNGPSSFGNALANFPISSGKMTTYNIDTANLAFSVNSFNYYTGFSAGTDQVPVTMVSFVHDGSRFEIKGRGGSTYILLVDGQLAPLSYFSSPSAGGIDAVNTAVDFGVRARRRIALYMVNSGFAGITTGQLDTLEPWDMAGLPAVSFMTDSYGSAPGDVFIAGPYWSAAMRLGLFRFQASVGGGSGYTAVGTGNAAFTASGRLAYMNRNSPDVVVVAGGINDGLGGMQAAATTVFTSIRSANPSSVIVATGPWTPSTAQISAAPSKRDAILAAMQALTGPWVFIDNVSGTWLNSVGKSGSIGNGPWQTGDGRQITFTAPLSAATSGTLTANWAGSTGSYSISFSDYSIRTATLTAGSSTVSWTGAVTATANAAAYTVAGNNPLYISDGIHPRGAGVEYLGNLLGDGIAQGIAALV